jgi:hypothetical protein
MAKPHKVVGKKGYLRATKQHRQRLVRCLNPDLKDREKRHEKADPAKMKMVLRISTSTGIPDAPKGALARTATALKPKPILKI